MPAHNLISRDWMIIQIKYLPFVYSGFKKKTDKVISGIDDKANLWSTIFYSIMISKKILIDANFNQMLNDKEKNKATLLLKTPNNYKYGTLSISLKEKSYISRDRYLATIVVMDELM